MCGIAGLYGVDLKRARSELDLRNMLALIRHRGPDEAGMYLADRLCMGTVRLSIVGVSTGQQPVSDDRNRHVLCYNGEVYNHLELRKSLEARGHTFRTQSDTEVVLNAWLEWGVECLPRLNGAFAFALYDSWQDKLYLARDRYGKRPLFHVSHRGALLFASEIKAFLGINGYSFEFDAQQLASIFTLWTPISDQTAFKDVRQVPQGSWVEISPSATVTKRYYQQDFKSTRSIRTEQEALERVRDSLSTAVSIRLRSDVEVGIYLSGGLDSSILAAILADQAGGEIRTYSVAFEDRTYDESSDQRAVASHVGSRHEVLEVSDRMLVEHLPAAAYHAEVPVFRTALVPMYLLSRLVHDDGIKVVMTGEGADEAFLGYDLFKETLLRRSWNALTDSEKIMRLRQLYPYLAHYSAADSAQLLGLYQQFATERYPGFFSHELRIQNGLFARRLLRSSEDGLEAMRRLMATHEYFSLLNTVQQAQWLEYQSLLPGYLLSSQGDRMSLAHSVENRCPFLDPHVVELSAAVNLVFDDGTDEKYLLRKAFASQLPPAIVAKRKRPYRAPDAAAFVRHRPDYLELILSEQALRDIAMLDAGFCKLLVRKILNAPAGETSIKEDQAFVFLLSLCLQHDQFVRRRGLGAAARGPIDDILVRVIDLR